MEIFYTQADLQKRLEYLRLKKQSIALVPTMGALHKGHLSLLSYAKEKAVVIICSIFVNPTQFNDPSDLEKYPRPIAKDIKFLKDAECDILFLPSVTEMYPADEPEWHVDLGPLEQIWEGEHRPGHFQGVTQIVYKLFQLAQPDVVCFGQKDIQQIKVIEQLIEIKKLRVRLIICPTLRDSGGLALSSRNKHLSNTAKLNATKIYESLRYIKEHLRSTPVSQLKKEALKFMTSQEGFDVEYLAICDYETLQEVSVIIPDRKHVALVAVWLDDVRLIDNMFLD